MQTWVVANQKGGVAKTTTALSLAGLSAASGMRVLFIDLDPQASASHYLGVQDCADKHCSISLMMNEAGALPVGSRYEGLDIFVGSAGLATLERQAPAKGQGLMLRRAIAGWQGRYDRVIIDTPPSLGTLLINALACANQLIIPAQTEPLAVHGVRQLLRTLQMLESAGADPVPRLMVATLHDCRTRSARETLERMRAEFSGLLWDDLVPIDTRLCDASRRGEILPLEDQQIRAAGAYWRLFQTLTRTLPMPDSGSNFA